MKKIILDESCFPTLSSSNYDEKVLVPHTVIHKVPTRFMFLIFGILFWIPTQFFLFFEDDEDRVSHAIWGTNANAWMWWIITAGIQIFLIGLSVYWVFS